jgi:hypothetical protein
VLFGRHRANDALDRGPPYDALPAHEDLEPKTVEADVDQPAQDRCFLLWSIGQRH